jgi:glycosyltransferase involved in cell wall biosynthesis/peptidoglycan/xylan/chitin deacetylase (PgdA/CDA1 family)
LFVDSDCILAPDCFRKHFKLHRTYRDRVICGGWNELSIDHHSALGKATDFESLYKHAGPDYRVKMNNRGSWENFYSGNASVSKSLFLQAEGFDEQGLRCHDLDLAYRMYRSGGKFRFSPECRAIHIEHPRSIVTRLEQARGLENLAAKCPEIAAHAEDRATMLRRAYQRTVVRCEAQFVALAASLPGFRMEQTWMLPAWYGRDRIMKAIRHVSHLTIRDDYHTRFVLRFDRDCWDYTFIHPERAILDLPQVTVLLTTHNAEGVVGRALQSVFAQSFQSFEIIVIDDASTDRTEEIVRTFAVDGRVRLFVNSENRGLARSLNRGLEAARGSIVVQLDADDWLDPEALQAVVRRLQSDPSIGAVFGQSVIHENGATRVDGHNGVRSEIDCLTYKGVQAPRAYRAELLRKIGGWSINDIYEGRFFEDRLTLARAYRISKVSSIRRPLYHVDVKPDSLSRIAPYQTAIAKFLILSAEANRSRLSLQAGINRFGFTARLRQRAIHPPKLPWSIIVPAHGRPELLKYSLRSWIESDALNDGVRSELIVVDDASPVALQEAIDLTHPSIRFVRLDRRSGPAEARNIGAAQASNSMLFFSDGDRIVPPDVLASHELRHAGAPQLSVVVGGRFGQKVATYVEPRQIAPEILRRLLEQIRFDWERFVRLSEAAAFGGSVHLPNEHDTGRLWDIVEPYRFADPYLARWAFHVMRRGGEIEKPIRFLQLGTGSVSISAQTFNSVGAFDESMQPMEDWEFGVRCEAAGIPIVSAPEIESLHQLHPSDPYLRTLHVNAMRSFQQKHPDIINSVANADRYSAIPGVEFIKSHLRPSQKLKSQEKPTCQLAAPDYISLTFDDGPHPVGSWRVLELLKRYNCVATFFVMGFDTRHQPEIIRALHDAGCEVGIHGWRHEPAIERTTGEIIHDLSNAMSAIADACGVVPKFCRPPYGIATASYIRAAAELGLRPVGWDASSRDWSSPSAIDLITRLSTTDIAGKVLLFHDGVGDFEATSTSLAWLLDGGRRNGLSLVTLSDFARKTTLPAVVAQRRFN